MLTLLNQLFSIKSQKVVTKIEYDLIAGLISVLAIKLLTTAGGHVQTIFTNIVNALTTAAGSGT